MTARRGGEDEGLKNPPPRRQARGACRRGRTPEEAAEASDEAAEQADEPAAPDATQPDDTEGEAEDVVEDAN